MNPPDFQYQPGDFIFYYDDGTLKDTMIARAEMAFHETSGIVTNNIIHVAMVTYDPMICVEMCMPVSRIRCTLLDVKLKIIKRPNISQDIIRKAIISCYMHLGEEYSVADIALAEFGISATYRYCSAWLYDRFLESGHIISLPPGRRKRDLLIDPDRLSQSSDLKTVATAT